MPDHVPPLESAEWSEAEIIDAILRALASKIKNLLPEGWGFSLFLFEFHTQGRSYYISSANREDFLASLREFLRRNESPLHPPSAGPSNDRRNN